MPGLAARLHLPLLKDATLVYSTNIASALTLFVGQVVLARFWGVAEFGVLISLFGLASIAVGLTDLGISVSVIRLVNAWRETDRAQYHFLFLLVPVVEGLPGAALVLLALAGAPRIAESFLHATQLTDAVRWTLLGAACMSSYAYASAMLQAHRQFLYSGGLPVVGMLARTLGMVAASLVWHSAEAVMLAYFLASLGLLAAGLVVTIRQFPPRAGFAYAFKRQGAARFFNFGKWVAVTATLNSLLLRVDVVMLTAFSSSTQVALYGVAFQMSLAAALAINMFNTVLLPRASSITSRAGLQQYVKQVLWLSSLVGGGLVLLLVFAEPLVTLFYGPSYLGAVPVLRLFLAGYLFYAFSYPFVLLTYRLDRPDLVSKTNVIGLVLLLTGDRLLVPSFGAIAPAAMFVALTIAGQGSILVWLALAGRQRAAQLGLDPLSPL